jgi:hypothetical protein
MAGWVKFVIIGYYAGYIASYGSFGTNYRFHLPGSSGPRRSMKSGKGKVKESRNRPGVSQRFPGDLGSQIFMTFGT